MSVLGFRWSLCVTKPQNSYEYQVGATTGTAEIVLERPQPRTPAENQTEKRLLRKSNKQNVNHVLKQQWPGRSKQRASTEQIGWSVLSQEHSKCSPL